MVTGPFWLEEAATQLPLAAAPGGCEVAVIGGGVTGCSCALTLAERGVHVRLYEAREIAAGASGRNGGFALRGGSRAYDVMRSQLGGDQARMLWELSERTIDRLQTLAGDAFARTGSLRLATDAAERDALQAELDALRADGFAAEWLDELGPPLGGLFRGAILHPTDGALQPARWVRRLAGRAVEAGAEIVQRTSVRPDEVDAQVVVVATDGFTAQLVPELRDVVRPTRGQVLLTEPLAEVLFNKPHYARDGYDYWQQLPDRRLLVGGCRDAGAELENTDVEETTGVVLNGIEQLVERLLGRVPAITHRWAGIWGTTDDGLPLVGRLPGNERVWIAAGYSGHGNVLGLACGDLLARAIVGDRPRELAIFDPTRVKALLETSA